MGGSRYRYVSHRQRRTGNGSVRMGLGRRSNACRTASCGRAVQVMAKPQDLPYKKKDVLRAFRLFSEQDAPAGCISPEQLERVLVGDRGQEPEAVGSADHSCTRLLCDESSCVGGPWAHAGQTCVQHCEPESVLICRPQQVQYLGEEVPL